jgi:hypothetical protein
LQVQCRRALIALGEANTTEILAWCGPRGRSRWRHCYFWLWRALEQIGAERVGRDLKAPGQPWIWRLRNTDEKPE